MSLNGDLVVMRNGRSTSQISIYNYPEHLNPFYEDDQHKRLRFWHIKKKGEPEGRRNSFSLTGLKDIWAFKSFRLKKKSSTLGINKTSESPPPLRRDMQVQYDPKDSNFLDPDRRALRYSTNSTNSSYDNQFHRNAIYRSSLQNVASGKESPSGFGLNRNDLYRRTIQNVNGTPNGNHRTLASVPSSRRYVYGGSVTPQPIRSSDFNRDHSNENLTRGSSQQSVASTNPFDTDYEDDNESFAVDGRNVVTSTPYKKNLHKKRRAPAPPVANKNIPNGAANKNFSTDSSQHKLNELHIDENLANLTAEIENFVHTSNEEPSKNVTTVDAQTSTSTVPSATSISINEEQIMPKSNGAIRKDSLRLQRAVTPEITITEPTPTPTKEVHRELRLEPSSPKPLPRANVRETQKVSRTEHAKDSSKQSEVGHVECVHVHLQEQNTQPPNEPSRVTSFKANRTNETEIITEKTPFTLVNNPRSNSRNTENVEHRNVAEELRIVEDSTSAAFKHKTNTAKPPIAAKPNLESKTAHFAEFPTVEKPKPNTSPSSQQLAESQQTKLNASNQITKSAWTKSAIQQFIEAERNHTALVNEIKLMNGISKKSSVFTNTKEVNISSTPSIEKQETRTESLKIVESQENILDPHTSHSTQTVKPVNSAIVRDRNEVLNTEFDPIYRTKVTSNNFEWKKSTLAPLETTVPPEKRKSVKDIIESINRSQRLLNAAAHKGELNTTRTYPIQDDSAPIAPPRSVHREVNNNLAEDFNKNLEENQQQVQRIFEEIQELENATGGSDDNQKLNNDEIFKKCRVDKDVRSHDYRESSPTASNLDWNPVPKPKRTKNISDTN